ncbi:MAG: HAD family hydrolase [Clostridium neonatale]
MFKAGIFDLDDTLYNYKNVNEIALGELRKYTCKVLSIDEELFDKAFKYGRDFTKEGLEEYAAGHNRMIYCQKTLEFLGVNPTSYALEMYEVYWNSILENMKLNDGVIELFEYFKNNEIKIAICTDLTTHIQHRKLRKLGIDKYIDCIVTSEEAGAEKPNIRMFNLCIEKLGISSGEAFYVGDSFKKDIVGANNAGILPIWYTNIGLNESIEKSEFEYKRIDKLVQVKEYINNS